MKVNRTQFFANKAMRANGNTKNRPEQLLARDLIQAHYSEKLETEYTPTDIKPLPDLDLTGDRSPRLDIAIPSKRIAIRLNGPPHDRRITRNYDRAQQVFLEMQEKPWKVVNFVHTMMPVLWRSHSRGLTSQELKMAYDEIRRNLDGVIRLPKRPDEKIIDLLSQN